MRPPQGSMPCYQRRFDLAEYLYRGPPVLSNKTNDIPEAARLGTLSIHELRPVPAQVRLNHSGNTFQYHRYRDPHAIDGY